MTLSQRAAFICLKGPESMSSLHLFYWTFNGRWHCCLACIQMWHRADDSPVGKLFIILPIPLSNLRLRTLLLYFSSSSLNLILQLALAFFKGQPCIQEILSGPIFQLTFEKSSYFITSGLCNTDPHNYRNILVWLFSSLYIYNCDPWRKRQIRITRNCWIVAET